MAEAVYKPSARTRATPTHSPVAVPAAEEQHGPLRHPEPAQHLAAGDSGRPEARSAAILRDPRVLQAGSSQRMRLLQQLQRSSGNSYVERVMSQLQQPAQTPGHSTLQRRMEAAEVMAEARVPTALEQATALQAAEVAEQEAARARSRGVEQANRTQAAQSKEQATRQAARQRAMLANNAAHAAAQAGGAAAQGAVRRPPAGVGVRHSAAMTPGAAATRRQGPTSPEADPNFQAVVGKVKGVSAQQRTHPPATTKAAAAQAAAESPASELSGKAADNQVGAMEQAKTPPFDAVGFKAKLMERIASLTPKTAEEADNFKESDKVGAVKGEMQGDVAQEQKQSQGPLAEQTAVEPDPSGVAPKPVTPLAPNVPGAAPADVGAARATPTARTRGEVEAPLLANSQQPDQQMAAANVTEPQLRTSNEPTFQAALSAKHAAHTQAQSGPQAFRQGEQAQLQQARGAAAQSAGEQTRAMHGDRTAMLQQVGGQQSQTKGKDEEERARVGADIQHIYAGVKTNVEGKLSGLDASVTQAFDTGAEAARQSFEEYVDARMNAYKERRYGWVLGWAVWLRDKLVGMPEEVNAFYVEGRDRYLRQMDAVIDQVVTIIGTAIAEAKAEIARGKQQIQEYVAGLPAHLQQVGQDAAAQIQGEFDGLEQSINSKQDELIDSLAQKYQEKLKAIDARIDELKAANEGLVQKAINAVVGVIKTIIELGRMLLQVLARVAEAIPKILSDPIGFLGNLIGGVKKGLQNFVANIGNHLKAGLLSWLFEELAAGGIAIPQSFDLKSILTLVMELLGMTWQFIRAQAVKRLGEKVVATLEGTFSIFKLVKEQGIGALWETIKEQVGTLKETVLDGIQEMVSTQVIQAGVEWLMGILGGPVGAFIKAAKAIVDIVMWFVNNGQRVIALVNAIIDSIGAIARGTLDQAAALIEKTLAQAVPVVISFLASLLGLGNLAGRIRSVVQKAKQPVQKAIGWVLDKAVAFARLIGGKIKGTFGGKTETEADKQKQLRTGVMAGVTAVERLKGRNVTAALIRPVLGGLKLRYRLGILEPVVQNGFWAVHGEVSRMTEYTSIVIDKKEVGLDSLRSSLNDEGLQTAQARNITLAAGSVKLKHDKHVFMWDKTDQGIKGRMNLEKEGKTVRLQIRWKELQEPSLWSPGNLKIDAMGPLGRGGKTGAWAYEGNIERKYIFIEGLDERSDQGFDSWERGEGWTEKHRSDVLKRHSGKEAIGKQD